MLDLDQWAAERLVIHGIAPEPPLDRLARRFGWNSGHCHPATLEERSRLIAWSVAALEASSLTYCPPHLRRLYGLTPITRSPNR